MRTRAIARYGVETVVDSRERDFESFCRRQSSKVAAMARAHHQHWLNRILRERDARSAELECTLKGFGRGGGASNYGKARDDY